MRNAVKIIALCGLLTGMASVIPNTASAANVTSADSAADTAAATQPNLLQNGSFEAGGLSLSPWIFRHDVAATLAVDTTDVADGTRAAKVTVSATSTATHLVQLRQEGVVLHAGLTYTVAFWAKASAPRVINARLQSSIAPYPTFKAVDVTVATSWQRFVFTYLASSDVGDAFVGFNLAHTVGDVSLDGVTLTDGNLVTNGGFETGGPALSPWIWRNDLDAGLSQDTTVKFAGAASAKITVPTAGSASHLVQLRQAIAALSPGRTYRVSFEVRASTARQANVRLQSSDAPYPTAAATTFNVATTWTHFSFQWTSKNVITDPFVGFNLAQESGTVWIDEVSVRALAGGTIITVAGTGLHGFSGDAGAAVDAALFLQPGPDLGPWLSAPTGLSVDTAGNLYIADSWNQRVREVSPNGTISTVAGNGGAGYSGDGGPATEANISRPDAVAVDAAGNVYAAAPEGFDLNQNEWAGRVRKVLPDGTISTYAGGWYQAEGDGGPATGAGVESPLGLAVDAGGSLYFSEADPVNGNCRVRRVSPTGIISTIAGTGNPGFSGDGGPATNATLDRPEGLAVDAAGNVYIADANNNRVRKVSSAGTISTVAGTGVAGSSGDGGPATGATLNIPSGVAVDRAGNLYVIEQFGQRVRKVSPTGTISTIAGTGNTGFSGDGGPATNATFNQPMGVALDNAGNLYIADALNGRVREVIGA